MGTIQISYIGLGLLLLLLVPLMIMNKQLGLYINRRIIYVTMRMLVQLTLVGLFLQYLFELNSPILNSLYLLVMIVVALFSALKSTKLPFKKVGIPLFAAFLIPNIVLILYFNNIVVQLDAPFDARYFIPIGGMLMGNSLSGIIVGLKRYYDAIKEDQKTYFYMLALGATRNEALKPYIQNAVTTSISPTLASLETIGLVHLPGMMTGQILGGSFPIVAIRYQMAIMIAILVIRYASTYLAIRFTSIKAFNEYDVLDI